MSRVSVIIPTYDRADVIGRAVDSVLGQTLTDLELLVVDDGSMDETPHVLAEYDDDRLTYLRHDENRGGSAARNTGLDAATGEYVAFLDSDDAWRPEKLERQVAVLDERSDDWVAVYCDAEFVVDDPGFFDRLGTRFGNSFGGGTAPDEGGHELVKHVLVDELHTSAGSTILARRDVVDAIGGFEESLPRFQDPDFLIRVLCQGKLAYVPETLVLRYDSADPDPELVAAADRQFLDLHRDTVEQLEADGHDIRAHHRHAIARAYLRNGQFINGLSHLANTTPTALHHYPGIAVSALRGLQARTSTAS